MGAAGRQRQRASAREDRTLDRQRSVLVVDRSEETREVLQTVLERRGLRILAARGATAGLRLARQHRPDLIVLDLELDDSGPENLSARFADQSRSHRVGLLMLGGLGGDRRGLPDGESVAKPYHYGPLLRKIEQLLGTVPQAPARSA